MCWSKSLAGSLGLLTGVTGTKLIQASQIHLREVLILPLALVYVVFFCMNVTALPEFTYLALRKASGIRCVFYRFPAFQIAYQ